MSNSCCRTGVQVGCQSVWCAVLERGAQEWLETPKKNKKVTVWPISGAYASNLPCKNPNGCRICCIHIKYSRQSNSSSLSSWHSGAVHGSHSRCSSTLCWWLQHAHAILPNDRLSSCHWSGSFYGRHSANTSQSIRGAVRTRRRAHVS